MLPVNGSRESATAVCARLQARGAIMGLSVLGALSSETITLSDNSPAGGLLGGAQRYRGTRAKPARSLSDRARYPSVSAVLASGNVPSRESRRNYTIEADFPNLVPVKPYCADYLSDGLVIRARALALKKRHVQLNGPSSFQWLTHDIDRPGAYFAHDDANLPPPNVIMVNPSNGHAHGAYLLATPVARHNFARSEPLRFYAAVERGIGRRLESDRSYAGLIAKNPLHADWLVEWRHNEPYTLHDLEGNLFERDMRPDISPTLTFGAGRNVTVFDEMRAVAYREVRRFKANGEPFDSWQQRCFTVASALNMQFPEALKIGEVRAIAKSVSKWTWKHFSAERFSARQSHLGRRGMAKRWAGHASAEVVQPWKSMGISRATYYRRKKEGTLT